MPFQAAYRQSPTPVESDASSGTIAITFDSAVVAGNFLWAHIDCDSGQTVNSVGDSVNGAASWTSAGIGINNANTERSELWYKENTLAGTPTVTVTYSASVSFRRVAVVEVSDAATSGAVDQKTSATGTSNSPSSGSVTTTTDNQYIAGALQHAGATISNPNGYTVEEDGASQEMAVLDKTKAAAGSESVAVTLSGSVVWSALIMTVKSKAGAPDTIYRRMAPTQRML